MDDIVNIDGNEVVALAPDLVEIRYVGELSAQGMQGLVDYLQRQSAETGYVLVLGDQSRANGLTPEARKLAAHATDLPLRAIAFHGGKFHSIIIAKLVLGVFRVVAKLPFEVLFAPSRDEALAWLKSRRERAAASPAAGGQA